MNALTVVHRAFSGYRLGVAVVLCAALGMAATAAVIQLLDMTGQPYGALRDGERLVRVWNTEIGADAAEELAWADHLDIAAQVRAFDAVEAAARARLIWHSDAAPPRRVEGEAVSPGYFGQLDVRPLIGRFFSAEESASAAPVMLIAHSTWVREFGQTEAILGREISVTTQADEQRRSYTVIGVMPPGFGGTIEEDMPDIEFWLPVSAYLSPDEQRDRSLRSTWLLARLRPDAGIDDARRQLDALAAANAGQYAGFDPQHRFRIEPFGASWAANYAEAAPLLLAAAVALLAIAAFDVFLLLLARVLEQRAELALRATLGASRTRLLGECALQGLLPVALGGAVGIVCAPWLLRGALAVGDLQLPTFVDATPDADVLLLSLLVLVAVAIAASLLPAWQVLRHDPAGAMAGVRSVSARSHRLQRGLIVAQIGMAVALLVAAVTLGQAWYGLARSDLGFATEQRLRMGLFVSRQDVPNDAALPAFIGRVDAALKQQPGVRAVGWVWPTAPIVDAVPAPLRHPLLQADDGEPLMAGAYAVRPGFFDTLGIPLLAGRDIDALDREGSEPVAVVGASVAERLGGPGVALGQSVAVGERRVRVVGVVGDVRFGGAAERSSHAHEIYLAYDQSPRRVISPIVHVDGSMEDAMLRLPQTLKQVAPTSAVDWVEPIDAFADWLLRDQRFRFMVLGLIAGSAMLLAGAGLYGLMSQQVVRQRREIGLRKALGASDGAALRMQLFSATALVAVGLVAGGVLAALLATLLRSRVPGIDALDPVAVALVAVALLVVALIAAVAPALRAARITPMEALREH